MATPRSFDLMAAMLATDKFKRVGEKNAIHFRNLWMKVHRILTENVGNPL